MTRYIVRPCRITVGSRGWFVVEPDNGGGAVVVGPMLSAELAYEVAVESESFREAALKAAVDRMFGDSRW